MSTRIAQLHKTEAEWKELQKEYKKQNKDFIPFAGELIIYDPDTAFDYARIKIGDGVTALQDLAFCMDNNIFKVLKTPGLFDAGRITKYTK